MADGSVVIKIDADNADAQKKLNQLQRDIEKTEKAINSTTEKRSGIAKSLDEAREAAAATAREIQEIKEQMAENESALSGRGASIDLEEFNVRKQAQQELTYELSEQEKLYSKQAATVANLEGKEAKLTSQLEQQTGQLEKQKDEAGKVERTLAIQTEKTMPNISAAIADVTANLKKGFKNILKWGFGIRSAFILIRRLRSAIKEGITTFAEYDQETKNNLSSLKNSLQELKATWGAAFAPILNAVAPYLQKLIDLLITAANYVQMFFSVLRGGTSYKKIIASNDDLAKSYGGAGSAAKDAKKQLLSFDEINKLDSQDSGGGGSGKSSAIEGVDEELIPPETLEKLQWIKDHLKEILAIAGAVGVALLAWKISSRLGGNVLGLLKTFKVVLGVIMAIAGAVLLVKNGLDAWNNGVNMDNLIGMLEGALLLVVGLGIAFGKTGAAIGLLVAGVAMLVVGLKDWITTGELSTETFLMLEAGILAVGAAIALLTGNWIPLLIAAVVGVALAVYKYWDQISAALKNAWESMKKWWQTTVVEPFKKGGEELRQDWENIKKAAINAFEKIRDGVKEKINAAREAVREAINKIKEFLNFEWKLPDIKLPHITVSWEALDGNNPIAKLLGIGAIPHLAIQWYARGGIVDGATLLGAGEAGKEAIVPLERNTEWINMVADGLIDRITQSNRLADYISGMNLPAIVTGQVVPPKAVTSSGSSFSDADIDRLVSGISAAFSGGEAGEQVVKLYLDGRQIAETVTKHQRRMSRSYA